MKILGIIIARGGSKGIPGKNIKKLLGKPLIAHTIEEALKSKLISRLIVSTDNIEIAKIGKDYGAEVPFNRPKNLSADDTPGLPVITHAVRFMEKNFFYSPDLIIVLQPTSPQRRVEHIDQALNLFVNSDADSVISVTEAPHNSNPYSVMNLENDGSINNFLDYDELNNLRQKKPKFYCRNGSIYACTYKCLFDQKTLYGKKTLPYFMEKNVSFDIDDETDWTIVETLMSRSL